MATDLFASIIVVESDDDLTALLCVLVVRDLIGFLSSEDETGHGKRLPFTCQPRPLELNNRPVV